MKQSIKLFLYSFTGTATDYNDIYKINIVGVIRNQIKKMWNSWLIWNNDPIDIIET